MAPLPPRSPAGRVKLLMVFQNLAPILIGNLPGVLYTSPGDDLIAGLCRISDASQPNVVKKNVFFFRRQEHVQIVGAVFWPNG